MRLTDHAESPSQGPAGARLTDEQAAFRVDLRSYLEEEIDPVVDEVDANGPMTRAQLLEYVGDLREYGVGFDPETAERFFGDPIRFAVASEEISRVWPSLNVALQMSFPAQFVQFAAEPTRDVQLPKLETGECIGCLAVTEPEGGSDTARPETTAYRDGDEFVLEGAKTWVGNGAYADVALVVAHDDEADATDMFLVDRAYDDYDATELDKLGWKAVSNARMELDGVRVPAENRFSSMVSDAIADGNRMHDVVPFPESVTQLFFEQKPLNAAFTFMRTGMAFMAVGIMAAAFDETLDRTTERETFGEPIAGHQLVQSTLFDMKANLEASRGLAWRALDAIRAGDDDARMLSSLAKGWACERCVDVTSDAIQVFGGEGLKTENRLERYFRDARVMPIPDGTTEIQRLVVGKELTGESAYT